MRSVRGTVLFSALWVLACGGGEGERAAATGEGQPAVAESQAAAETQDQQMQQTTEAAVDAALVSRGEAMFQSKGCSACHTVGGGRLVGPDLAGVTQRREGAFVIAMISNPDSMLVNDETAKQLLAEYYTPMSNQGLSVEEAEALLAYLTAKDAE